MGDKNDVGLRMGTKVQCTSYSPEYYSMRDLNEDASSSSWSLCYEDKTLKSEPYYNCFLRRPATDGYSEYDKEMLKQTMLKQEAMFKNQVYELHRLYRVQRNLIDELKRKELHKYPIPMTASQSNPLSSLTPSENAQNLWQIPGSPLVNSARSNMQSHLNFIKESSIQAVPVPTQNGGSLQDDKLLESKSKKVSRKGFDLQLPASEYLDCEEGVLGEEEEAFQASVTNSYSLKRNCEVAPKSDVNQHGLADLNEPVQVELATDSAPVREIQGQDLLAKPNSFFLGLPREIFQNTQKGRDNGVQVNVLPSENERKSREWPSFNLEAGQSRSNLNSSSPGFYPEKSSTQSESIQAELKTTHELPSFLLSNHSKREPWREKVFCGLEISERCQNLPNNNYLGPFALPHLSSSCPSIPKSDAISGSSSISFWLNPTNNLSQNPLSAKARSCFNTSSKLSVQSPRPIGDRWHLSSNSASNSSFGSEVSYRNGFCHRSNSESTASNVRFPSVGFDYLNGSVEHLENDGPTKYFRGSNQMELDLLQCHSQKKVSTLSSIQEFPSVSSANVAEPQRIEVGDCWSNKKILGFTILDKPHISKDQSSFSPSSKSLQYPYEVEEIQNRGKVGILNIDLSRDPALPHLDGQLSSKNLIIDKGPDKDRSGSLCHINLNSCANEIDLEVPVAPYAMEGIVRVGDSSGNQLETPDELVKVAAEAIVTMSSLRVHNHSDNASCHPLEASTDSLHWFAEMVTSNIADPKSEAGKDRSDHDEFSDGIDCFESMTLKLTETKVDECYYKPWVHENQKVEETGAALLLTRRRRGQARRGRQRKDFQRDVLPGLVSLSRHEVTEDLQMLGGLMRAMGHPWQTRLARRNTTRTKRLSQGPDHSIVAASTVCSPPRQQPNNGEVGLEERSLKGWGKTTRRPRRQRFPVGTPISLTQA